MARWCLLLLALVVWGCSRPAGEEGTGTPSTIPPPVPDLVRASRQGRRVLFVGLDGADWRLLDGYMADGAMPNLAALAREGQSGVLTTLHPPLSPLVWTTMMTGVSPLEHRVLDFTEIDPRTGKRQPITSAERRVPAVWNMASWAGRGVAVLGLWATWPAEPVRGLMVADRFSSFTARDPEPPAGVVFPPERAAWARRVLRESLQETGYDEIHGYFPWLARAEYERIESGPEPYSHPVSALRRILVETRAYHRLAMEWLARARPDLALVYFQGTDSIGHIFAPYAPPRQPAVSAADFARYGGVPRRYFAAVDRLLGEYRAQAERSGAVLLLASDHGFYWGEGRPAQLASARAATAGRWHRDEGIYLLWGPGVQAADAGSAGAQLSRPNERTAGAGRPSGAGEPAAGRAAGRPRASVSQVCATLLALLGLPPGKGLAGPPVPGTPGLPAAGTAAGAAPALDYRAYFRPAAPPESPASSAPRPGGMPNPAGEDEKLAQLRALGYIGAAEPRAVRPPAPSSSTPATSAAGASTTSTPGASPAGTSGAGASPTFAAGASPTRTAGSFNNEGLLLRQLGRTAEARAAFEQALARDPGLASAQWNLSDLLFSATSTASGPGGRDRADALLIQALTGGLPDGVERTLDRAAIYGREGAPARSLALLDRAVGARPDEPRLRLLRGRYRLAQRLCEPALADFTRAAELVPTDPLAHASAGLAHLCRGDEAGALAEFRRSLALDPNQPEIRRFLSPGG